MNLSQVVYDKRPIMKLREYIKSKKMSIRGFGRKNKISHYSMNKYVQGKKPSPRLAWRIFMATQGQVGFNDLGYEDIPKNPLKDL